MQCPKCGSHRNYDNMSNTTNPHYKCVDCGERFIGNRPTPTPQAPPVIPQPAFVPQFKTPAPPADSKPNWDKINQDKTKDIKWQVAVKAGVEISLFLKNETLIRYHAENVFDILMNPPVPGQKPAIKKDAPLPFDDDYPEPENPNADKRIQPIPPEQNFSGVGTHTTPQDPPDDRGLREKQEATAFIHSITDNCHTHPQWEEAKKLIFSKGLHPNDNIYFEQLHNMWQEDQTKKFSENF